MDSRIPQILEQLTPRWHCAFRVVTGRNVEIYQAQRNGRRIQVGFLFVDPGSSPRIRETQIDAFKEAAYATNARPILVAVSWDPQSDAWQEIAAADLWKSQEWPRNLAPDKQGRAQWWLEIPPDAFRKVVTRGNECSTSQRTT